jgi:hypothetical protein
LNFPQKIWSANGKILTLVLIYLIISIIEVPTVPDKLYYSLVEAQLATGISLHTWRVWAQDGKVTFTRAGTKILIPASEIERILRIERKERRVQV